MSSTQKHTPNWSPSCALTDHQTSVRICASYVQNPPPSLPHSPSVKRLVVRVVTNSLVVLGLASTSYAIVLAVENAESTISDRARHRLGAPNKCAAVRNACTAGSTDSVLLGRLVKTQCVCLCVFDCVCVCVYVRYDMWGE